MHRRVYLTVGCLSHRSTAAVVAGGFAAEHPSGRRYRSTAASAVYQLQLSSNGARPQCSVANVGSVMLTAEV